MKQGKVVILGGTPRAGKTTLAVNLTRNGFSKISFDSLSEAIRKGFDEVFIEDWTCQEICAEKKYKFFESIIESLVNDAKIYGLNTVIDMYDFLPEYINKLPFQKDIEVYFLAYPDISIGEIKHNIKFYAESTDWIAQVDEEYLDVVAKRCYFINQKLVKQCKEYGYDLINTGVGDERTKTLDKLLNRIISGRSLLP
jgi:2-phosphoglycerate kinase